MFFFFLSVLTLLVCDKLKRKRLLSGDRRCTFALRCVCKLLLHLLLSGVCVCVCGDVPTINVASVSLSNSYLQGSVVQRWKIRLVVVEGGVPQSRGTGRVAAYVPRRTQGWRKRCGEMHPARASVLMRSTLPLHSPACTTAAP